MATTRIISMHVSHGKTIADCLTDRIDYSKNPEKTQGGELISSYECDPKTADAELFPSTKSSFRRKNASARFALSCRIPIISSLGIVC